MGNYSQQQKQINTDQYFNKTFACLVFVLEFYMFKVNFHNVGNVPDNQMKRQLRYIKQLN